MHKRQKQQAKCKMAGLTLHLSKEIMLIGSCNFSAYCGTDKICPTFKHRRFQSHERQDQTGAIFYFEPVRK